MVSAGELDLRGRDQGLDQALHVPGRLSQRDRATGVLAGSRRAAARGSDQRAFGVHFREDGSRVQVGGDLLGQAHLILGPLDLMHVEIQLRQVVMEDREHPAPRL